MNVLAVPISAPWLKMSEVAEFLKAVQPKRCFPTHNGLLNERGQSSMHRWVGLVCEREGIEVVYLKAGEGLEV